MALADADTPTLAPAGAGQAERARAPFLDRGRRALAGAAALALLAFVASWLRHATFRSGIFDLAVFDQALWKMANGMAPEVSTVGWNVFADHLSPVLLVFVPLYDLVATPLWLLGAQALAFGLGFLALGPALDALGVRRWRAHFAFAYAASVLLWNGVLFDFHPTTLAIPLLLAGLTAALRDDLRALAIVAVGLVLLRDDLGAAAAALALIGTLHLPARRRLARAGLVAAGLAWVLVGARIGAALGSDRHFAFHYGAIADGPLDALAHPWRTLPRLALAVARWDNLLLAATLLLSLGFLPLRRPGRLALTGVLALPLLASAGLQFHDPRYHYGVVLFPFLLWAAAGGLEGLEPARCRAWVRHWLPIGVITAFLLVGPTWMLPERVDPTSAARAIATIAPDERVAATNRIGAHLAHRETLVLFPYPFLEARALFPFSAEARTAAEPADIDVVLIEPRRTPEDWRVFWAWERSEEREAFTLEWIGDVRVYRR